MFFDGRKVGGTAAITNTGAAQQSTSATKCLKKKNVTPDTTAAAQVLDHLFLSTTNDNNKHLGMNKNWGGYESKINAK